MPAQCLSTATANKVSCSNIQNLSGPLRQAVDDRQDARVRLRSAAADTVSSSSSSRRQDSNASCVMTQICPGILLLPICNSKDNQLQQQTESHWKKATKNTVSCNSRLQMLHRNGLNATFNQLLLKERYIVWRRHAIEQLTLAVKQVCFIDVRKAGGQEL